MTTYYVSSTTGSNSNNGLSSGAPKKYLDLNDGSNSLTDDYTLTSADTVYILTGHTEYLALADVTLGLGDATIVGVNSLSSPTAFTTASDIYIGHQVAASSARDLYVTGVGLIRGMTLAAGESLQIRAASAGSSRLIDCDLKQLSSSETFTIGAITQDGTIFMDNVNCYVNGTNVALSSNSNVIIWTGGSIQAVAGTPPGLSFGVETGTVQLNGIDLSNCSYAIAATGAESGLILKAVRCKLPSNIGPPSFDTTDGTRFEFYNSGTADNYYNFDISTYAGEISLDTSQYLDATYNGSTGYSVLMDSNANSTKRLPLYYNLCEIPSIDLTTSKTITVEISQVGSGSAPTALQNDEFWVAVESTDGTDLALAEYFKSTETMVFESPSDLTSSSETWNVTTDVTNQKVSVVLDAVTGASDVPLRVLVYLAAPSLSVNVDPAVTVS